MKVLIVLYSRLKENKEKLYKTWISNINLLTKMVGIDNLYISLSGNFIEFFDLFPNLCFVNNKKDNFSYGAYIGLRKLRSNDVLLIDGNAVLSKENLVNILKNAGDNAVAKAKDGWAFMSYILKRDIDYLIKSFERCVDGDINEGINLLRKTFGIEVKDINMNAGKIRSEDIKESALER